MRLQKFLRDQNVASSLRKVDELVQKGHIQVNGRTISEPTLYLKPNDKVRYRHKVYCFVPSHNPSHSYLMLNKPLNMLCTRSDPYHRRTIYDLLPPSGEKKPLHYAGRLDYDSEGMVILSTNGVFVQRLTHPSYGVWKEYHVGTHAHISWRAVKRLSTGSRINGVEYAPFRYKRVSPHEGIFWLMEGKKRELRLLMQHLGLQVVRLKRVAIGSYRLGDLPLGKWAVFTPRRADIGSP